jgi:short-subunit dehydrogenase
MRAQGYGRIINCSSVLGFIPYPWRGSYVATKYAIEGLTDTLRLEMSDTDIKVILLQPGPITSKFRLNAINGFERWIEWKASARCDQYRSKLINRLYDSSSKKDKFELPPSAVTKKLIRALEDPIPKSKYLITTPTYVAAVLKRILPNGWIDRILSKK